MITDTQPISKQQRKAAAIPGEWQKGDLVDNAIQVVGNIIAEQVSSVTQLRQIYVIEDYQDGSDWKSGC